MTSPTITESEATPKEAQEAAEMMADVLHKAEKAGEQASEHIHDTTQHQCPRCYFDLKSSVALPTEEEQQEYLRRLLAGEPFVKTYKLFKGQLEITCSTLTVTESEHMVQVLREIAPDPHQQLAVASEILKVKALYYIRSAAGMTYPQPTEIEPEEGSPVVWNAAAAQALYEERFGQMGEDMISILVRTQTEFNRLVTKLADSGFDQDFFKGAGIG